MSSFCLQQQPIGSSKCFDWSSTRLNPWPSIVYSLHQWLTRPNGTLWHYFIYADDIVLFISSKSIHSIESKLNSNLDKVSQWLTSNQLTLNISKSKFIIIGSNQRLSKLSSILITSGDKGIEEVSSFTYLGVVINRHLS